MKKLGRKGKLILYLEEHEIPYSEYLADGKEAVIISDKELCLLKSLCEKYLVTIEMPSVPYIRVTDFTGKTFYCRVRKWDEKKWRKCRSKKDLMNEVNELGHVK